VAVTVPLCIERFPILESPEFAQPEPIPAPPSLSVTVKRPFRMEILSILEVLSPGTWLDPIPTPPGFPAFAI
jgi:hypothetical protein